MAGLKFAILVAVLTVAGTSYVEAQPVLDFVDPSSGTPGSPGFTLTVGGTNFTPASVVRWNGAPRPTTYLDSFTLTANIPASDVATFQTALVTVDGSNPAAFAVSGLVPVASQDLAYDRFSRRLYASVPSTAPNGNSIVQIDPFTSYLGTSVWIGSEPGKLAVSDNGQYLYASLNGAAAVRRMDLASLTPGLQFSLGSDSFSGPNYPSSLAVLPGNSASVAVIRGGLNNSSGTVAIYDDGVQRPAESQFPPSNVIAFADSASTLYGLDQASGQLVTMAVTTSGISMTQSSPNSFLSGNDIRFDNGLIYSTSGAVVDPATMTVVGIFDLFDPSSTTAVVPDSSLNRVFFLSLTNSVAYVDIFDETSFAYVGTLSFTNVVGTTVDRLVRWGDDGLAFRTDGGQIFLSEIPKVWLGSVPALSASPPGLTFGVQAAGTSSSPQTLVLTNNTASSINITSITPTTGFTQSNACGTVIAAFGMCSISVTFSPGTPGTQFGTLSIVDSASGSPQIMNLVGGLPPAGPSITAITPDTAIAGSTGFTLTVTGTNFVSGSIVRWNGLNRPTSYVSSSMLTASITADNLAGMDAATITVFNPSPVGESSNSVGFAIYGTIALTAKDLVYNPASNQIYASVPGSVPGGNSIVNIDPLTGAVGQPTFVGSEPGKLAISDNAQYLYVVLDGAAAIRRVNLPSQTPDILFSAGNGSLGPNFPTDIAVLPGNSSSLAVAAGSVAIFDNGVRRAATTTGGDKLAFSASSAVLYGLALGSPSTFNTMSVDSGGVSATNSVTGLIAGAGATGAATSFQIKFDGGRIFAVSGTVVDGPSGTLAGTLQVRSPYFGQSITVDPSLDLVFVLAMNATDSSSATIFAYSKTKFTLLGSLILSGAGSPAAASAGLLRWGGDGLAFRTANGQIVLIRIPAPWLSASPAISISPLTLIFPPQNVGSGVLRAATLTNNTASPIPLSGISTTGDFNQNNNCGTSLAAFAMCSINVTFTPTLPGPRSGLLTILNASGTPVVAGLSGTGNGSVALPLITSISPSAAPAGSPGFTLTVTGQNFISGAVVQWNGITQPTTFVNGTTLTANIPSSNLAVVKSPAVTVLNAPNAASNSAVFVIYRSLSLTTSGLIYDPTAGVIRASIPPAAPSGNSIIPIDPATGNLGSPTSIGFEPGKMAVSDNGQYLYVSKKWYDLIDRVDLTGNTAVFEFSLGSGQLGLYSTADLKVLPGNPTALAVARSWANQTGLGGTGVYDNGVVRSVQTGFANSSTLAFGNSSLTLYGVDNEYSGTDYLQSMSIDSTGVVVTSTVRGLTGGGDIAYDRGLLYSTSGRAMNPGGPSLAGTYSLPGFANSVVPDSSIDRMFFLTSGGGILTYSLSTFTAIGQLNIPASNASNLLRWGTDGLAFRSDTNLFLLQIPAAWSSAPANRRRSQLTSQ